MFQAFIREQKNASLPFVVVTIGTLSGGFVNTSNHASKSEAEAARNRINGEA